MRGVFPIIKRRIESLDSLRGISAMVVVVFHCLMCFELFYTAKIYSVYGNELVKWMSITPLHTLWAGTEAVILFFVLSVFH